MHVMKLPPARGRGYGAVSTDDAASIPSSVVLPLPAPPAGGRSLLPGAARAPLQAALLMSLSALCFATNALCIKLLGRRYGGSSFELVWARGMTALVLNIAVLARMDSGGASAGGGGQQQEEGKSGGETAAAVRRGCARSCISRLLMRERGGSGRLLALRAGFGFCGVACDYYALVMLPLQVASVLIFTSPVWAALGARVALAEPLRAAHGAALCCCMCGVVLIMWQQQQQQQQQQQPPPASALFPCCVAVLGAMLNASAFVTMRAIGSAERAPVTVQAYLLACSLAAPVGMAVAGQPWVAPALHELGLFGVIGVLGLAGQQCMTRSFQLQAAGPASIFRYLEVVFAFVYGRWVLHQRASESSWLGAALVIAACACAAPARRAPKAPTLEEEQRGGNGE